MREVIDELDTALNDTLAFDFESIVDPAHGAPSAAVLVGPPPASRPASAAAKTAGTEGAETTLRAGRTEKAETTHGARMAEHGQSAAAPKADFNDARRDDDAGGDDTAGDDAAADDAAIEDDDEGPDLGSYLSCWLPTRW